MLLSRTSITLAAAGLLFLATAASAQRGFPNGRGPFVYSQPINPNPFVAPGLTLQQYAYNTAVLGRAAQNIPPYLLGYNPYPQRVYTQPAVNYASPISPYAISTAPVGNPYTADYGASLSTSPYSLSTTGSSPVSPYAPYAGGYAGGSLYGEVGGALQGAASLVQATGQYQVSIQQARILREQSRTASMDNTRRQIELQRWYETTKRDQWEKYREQEATFELDRIRKDAPDSDINSAKALNMLLASVQKSASQLNRGPNVPLREELLKNINVSASGASGNVSMLRDLNKLTWPEGLMDAGYDEARKRISRNLALAVATLKGGDPVPETTRSDIKADYKTINDRLNDAADDLSTQQYIEARRFLNQVNQSVRALSDPNAIKYFNNAWSAKGKNIAELVANMTQQGLTFAPAAPGDQPAYKTLYLALRQFEAGLETVRK